MTTTETTDKVPSMGHDTIELWEQGKRITATALQNYDNTLVTVHEEANRMGKRLTQLAKDMETGRDPNSLGELQGNGSQFDVQCGVLHARKEALESACRGEGIETGGFQMLINNCVARLIERAAK